MDGKTQSLVNIVVAVIGNEVRDIKISLTARLHIKTERTDDKLT